MRPITSIVQLQAAFRRPLTMLFVHVGWAAHSFRSRSLIQRTLEANPSLSSQIDWFVIDTSEEDNELFKYFASWLKAQEAKPEVKPNILGGGYGSILALREGTIVGSVLYVGEQQDEFESLLNQLQADS